MTKKKHPQDRAERLKINELKKKKHRKSNDVESLSKRSLDAVPSDE